MLFGFLAARTTTHRVRPGRDHPAAAPDRAGRQAGGRDRRLSKGRLRLGVGIGWNDVEYEALGENFHNRGARCEEQIDLLRKLWADEVITYEGRWHKVTEAGLNPLPPQRSIPIWLGGMAPQVVDRVARLADGWMPHYNPELHSQVAGMREAARAAGRDPATIGVECMTLFTDDTSKARDRVKELQDIGLTHMAVVTMKLGLRDPAAHIDAIARYRDAVGDLGE